MFCACGNLSQLDIYNPLKYHSLYCWQFSECVSVWFYCAHLVTQRYDDIIIRIQKGFEMDVNQHAKPLVMKLVGSTVTSLFCNLAFKYLRTAAHFSVISLNICLAFWNVFFLMIQCYCVKKCEKAVLKTFKRVIQNSQQL